MTETTINDLIATVERVEQRVFNAPRYTHDCARCTPLGSWADYDLYFCRQTGGLPTFVARYSSEGALYVSGPASAHPALAEAKKRARAAGLLVRVVNHKDGDATNNELSNLETVDMASPCVDSEPSGA